MTTTVIVLLCLCIFIFNEKSFIIPLLIGILLVPGVAFNFGAFDFSSFKAVVLAAVIKLILLQEYPKRFLELDKAVALWAIAFIAFGTFLESFPGFVNRTKMVIDFAGIYYVLRGYLKNSGRLRYFTIVLGATMIPVAILMLFEKYTGSNMFSVFGMLSENSVIRDGRIRAQGPFSHPILAGTAGALSIPFFMNAWFQEKKGRTPLYVFIIGSITMVFASSSSGPILSFLIFILGMSFWYLREKMKMIQWSMVCAIIALHIFMESPVWYLIARIDLTGSSTGWHRAELITSAIEHFKEWWLVGTTYTRHWMPSGVTWSSNHTDITNAYIRMGVWGGLFTMLAYLNIIISAFKRISCLLFKYRSTDRKKEIMTWVLGASLLSHAITLVTINYFDQINLFFYGLLAVIASFETESRNSELYIYNKQPQNMEKNDAFFKS